MMTTVFDLADRLVDELCELRPTLATVIGVKGHDHEWGDLGLASIEAERELATRYRSAFAEHVGSPHFGDRLAARVSLTTLEESLAADDAGDRYRDLRHLGCTFHELRNVFDVMPKDTAEGWDNIVARLGSIGEAFGGYIEVLDEGLRRGVTVARRQAESVASQADALAGEGSALLLLLDEARVAGHRTDLLERAVGVARSEAGRFASWLRRTYMAHASPDDAVGDELYRHAADRLVGVSVDPEAAYEWGWEELHRLLGEMEKVGERIVPGARWEEVREYLENDPATTVDSTRELVEFVSELLATAVEQLAGTHFDVPDAIRPITVQVAPPGGPLGVYYLAPSEDLSRPGGVWYSVGDQRTFPLYQHASTAYHEGFPGHHLQIATALHRKDSLSRAHRLLTWYAGYGEGWAMYAEVLMGELGYLQDHSYHFGMLAKQLYRAARVVVDIGLHLKKRIPEASPMMAGEQWAFESAVEFMRVYGFRTPAQAEAEVLRYLGWPGQAIAYKLGEREILSIREETRARLGPGFDLREFHAAVLDHGTMRLDHLRSLVAELLGEDRHR